MSDKIVMVAMRINVDASDDVDNDQIYDAVKAALSQPIEDGVVDMVVDAEFTLHSIEIQIEEN